MLIVGAGGFAREVVDIVVGESLSVPLKFYDDVSPGANDHVYEKYELIRTIEGAKEFFLKSDNRFVLGVGLPEKREMLSAKFIDIGGEPYTLVSEQAIIGRFDVHIGLGSIVMPNTVVSNGARIGKSALVYFHCSVTHDVIIGDFAEISPGATLLGGAKIGRGARVGANATILPGVSVGDGAVVGAGAVVAKDVLDRRVVVGVPAREK